eukprot:scaffold1102_cov147-Amphora_coffeaeformis.AAC.2
MKREGSLDFDEMDYEKSGSIPEEAPPMGAADDEEELNLPPGRLHSTRVKEKLSGSCGNLNTVGSFHSSGSVNNKRSKSFTHPHEQGTKSPGGSRSRSPSLKERTTTTTAVMGDSSISSLEDFVDNDILYDRQGLIDDLSQSSSKNMAVRPPMTNLPSVNERLSEETLDDCHAFADVAVRSSNASRAASVGTDRELFLDPLDEIDEEGAADDASLEDPSETYDQQVILTNMEKIAISHPRTEDTSAAASALARGSSSIMDGETPSNA